MEHEVLSDDELDQNAFFKDPDFWDSKKLHLYFLIEKFLLIYLILEF